MSKQQKVTVVGGGLGGALAACYFARAGHEVDVFEMRDDMRTVGAAGGRSINLAISHRGIEALRLVDLADDALQQAVPMRGRMIHGLDGRMKFQPYHPDGQKAINSISRSGLNALLLDAADRHTNVRLHCKRKCTGVDLEKGSATFVDPSTGEVETVEDSVIIGADGAFSAVRQQMQKLDRFDYEQSYLRHGYKELTIPAGSDGTHLMEPNALHIWPRRSLMMIALPNTDGSFTCTLFWPFEGAKSFANIQNEGDLLHFFNEHFADAVPLMPDFVEEYFRNPTGSLATIRCQPWYVGGRVVLLGDACHAVVPFYGQGMNAAFEDVIVLDQCMQRYLPDWERAFKTYQMARKEDVDVLADLAIGNFVEMRDLTGSRRFHFKKMEERLLHKLFPKWYIPLYTMVSFTRMPYSVAVTRARRQDRVVDLFLGVLILLLLFIIVAWIW